MLHHAVTPHQQPAAGSSGAINLCARRTASGRQRPSTRGVGLPDNCRRRRASRQPKQSSQAGIFGLTSHLVGTARSCPSGMWRPGKSQKCGASRTRFGGLRPKGSRALSAATGRGGAGRAGPARHLQPGPTATLPVRRRTAAQPLQQRQQRAQHLRVAHMQAGFGPGGHHTGGGAVAE